MVSFIKSKKFVIIVVILGLFIAGGFLYVYYKEYKSGNLKAKETLAEIEKVEKELSSEDSPVLKENTYYSIQKLYDVLHRMSNGKIIAEDNEVWGTLPMNKDDIATLKSVVEQVNYRDRAYLLEVLNRWEKGDFSHIVEEHNYFWDNLGGTVGKAIGVKE